MAKAVAKGAKQKEIEVVLQKVEETKSEDLLAADGIILGSPTYYGQMSAKMKALIDQSVEVHKKLSGKVGAAFTNSGGYNSGSETTLLSIVHALFVHGMIIQGRADAMHYGVGWAGTPNKECIEYCEDLGKNVASLVLKLKP